MKQLKLFQNSKNISGLKESAHGGSLRKGQRKIARPVATKKPMHLVLRSDRAKGKWSLLTEKNALLVDKTIKKAQRKFRVKILQFANVGNHIHLVVKAERREDFQNFLRFITGAIVFGITKCAKGNPVGRFWSTLAWTRVINWGADLKKLIRYIGYNLIEANPMISSQELDLFLEYG